MTGKPEGQEEVCSLRETATWSCHAVFALNCIACRWSYECTMRVSPQVIGLVLAVHGAYYVLRCDWQ